jgi:hypothetical protein
MMASQEHSEASSTAKEENLPSVLDVTRSIPVTAELTLDETHKSPVIIISSQADQHTEQATADEVLLSADNKDAEQSQLQDDFDAERTIRLSKNALNTLYKAPAPVVEDVSDLTPTDTSQRVNVTPLPLYPKQKARKKTLPADAGLQYSCTIQGRRRRFNMRGAWLPLIAVIIFILGTLGILYYSGLRFGSSTAEAVASHVVTTPGKLTPAAKTLPVQGSLITSAQGYTNSTQQTVYVDPQRHIQLLSSPDGQSWQQADLTQLTVAPLANGTGLTSYHWDKGGKQQIAYVDALGHIHLMSSGANGHWQVLDLTQRASAPLSDGVTLVGYQWSQTGSQQIIFLDQAQHIEELESTDGTNWHVTDITALTHTVIPNGLALTAFIWTRADEEQIVYVDANRHVMDLSTTPNGNWQSIDLTQTYHAPLSNGNVIVGYEWSINGTMQIDYIASNNHIQELSDSLQGKWTLSDVTATTNSPVTNGLALAGDDWIQGGERVLFYVDVNKHIQELSQLPQENWNEADLTQLTSSPVANGAGLLGYAWSINGSQQVVYVDATHHLAALSDIANSSWRKVNW